MMPAVLIALAQALPAILQVGAPIAATLIDHMTTTAVPQSGLERFISIALAAMPTAIRLGQDVTDDATRLSTQVSTMLAEKRGPTDAEWADQANRIAAKDGRLDRAARTT